MPHAIAPYLTPLNLAYALIAVNFVAFAMFGIDKAKAERGAWRIPEATLLWLAFWGGTPGAYAGRALFRHKTRKQPFVGNLRAIAVLQVVVLAALLAFIGWRSYAGLFHQPRQQREQDLTAKPHRAGRGDHAAQPRRKAEPR